MSNQQHTPPTPGPRKWYCNDHLTDDYKIRIREEDGDLWMYKAFKWLRVLIVNVGIIVITVLSLLQGAEATIVGTAGLISLGAYNGVEYVDYISFLQAVREVQSEQEAQNNDRE